MDEIGMMTRAEQTWQDVSAMWEADAAAEWERLNADDPEEEKLKEAASSLDDAYRSISKAIDFLFDAENEVEGTVAEDKVASLLNDLEDLMTEVGILQCKMEKGEC